MDRTPYTEKFNADHVPVWKCPICASGHLTLPKGSLIDVETAVSASAHSHEAWDPDWIETVFACVFQCSNGACQERIACTGKGTTDFSQHYGDDGDVEYQVEGRLSPRYFHPPLVLMDIPKACPQEAVRETATASLVHLVRKLVLAAPFRSLAAA